MFVIFVIKLFLQILFIILQLSVQNKSEVYWIKAVSLRKVWWYLHFNLFQKAFWSKDFSSDKLVSPCCCIYQLWSACVWLTIHHLVWQRDRGAVNKWALFVSSFEKISEELPFPLYKDGPPPHKAEIVLLQDVVAVLHHLGGSRNTIRCTHTVNLIKQKLDIKKHSHLDVNNKKQMWALEHESTDCATTSLASEACL